MAKEYLEYFVTFFPSAETSINPEKPRRGAFNIRLYYDILIVRQRRKFILFSITTDSGDIIEVWDGKSKGPPRKEKFPDKDSIVEKMKKLSS